MLNNSINKENKKTLVNFALSILSIFILPISFCFSIGFAIGALISLLVGILRTFGVNHIPLFVFSIEPPSYLSLPFALIVSLIFLAVAYISGSIFKKYLALLKAKDSELK